MSSLNKVRLSDGRTVSMAEWYHQTRFSTIEFAAADAVDLRMYNYVPGQTVPSTPTITNRQATEADTNMIKPKAMNQDEAIIVMAITYEAFALDSESDPSGDAIAPQPMLSGTDLRRLQHQGVFQLYVGANIKKPQYEIPFAWLCQSIGTQAWISGDGGISENQLEYGTAGVLSAENQELLRLPIYIGGFGQQARPGNAMHFSGRFQNVVGGPFTRLRQNVRLRFHLDGLSKRPA